MKHEKLLIITLLLVLSACAPVKRGPTEQSFIAEGQPNIEVLVEPPLRLSGSGKKSIRIKNDRMSTTNASVTYSVFSEKENNEVKKHAHIFLASIPGSAWTFSPLTYPERLAISTSKEKISGKNFTIQILLIPGEKDWFNELWSINKFQPSDAWLAMRWTTDPNSQERIVAEYREPLPRCLSDQELFKKMQAGTKSSTLDTQILWMTCKDELLSFRESAYKAFSFKAPVPGSQLSGTNELLQTIRDRPDFSDLIGETEYMSHSTFRYPGK